MKKLLVSLSMFLLALSGCNSIKEDGFKIEGTNDSNIKELAKQTVLGFSGLKNISRGKLARRNLNENEIIDVKEALNEIDLLLKNDSKLVINEIESSRDDFKNSLELKFSMINKEENFTLFYNEIITKEDNEDNEIEKEFKGVALYNDQEFNFRYSFEEEKDIDESEIESSFTLLLNEKDYIRINQSIEEELNEKENSYSYKVVKDNKVLEEFKFNQEEENGKLHVDLIKNGKRYKVNYINKNNEELIKVALKEKNEEVAVGYFRQVINDGITSYEFVE